MDKSNVSRRDLIRGAAAAGIAAALPGSLFASDGTPVAHAVLPLTPPAEGPIKVAFLVSEGYQMIDFAGPWEVFQDVVNPKTGKPAFELFTVCKTRKPIRSSGGLKVIPDYDFKSAPKPNIVVIPAQTDDSEPVLAWLRKVSKKTDVTMSVCTGAVLLAGAGLLDGHHATTHHTFYKMFAREYPKVFLVEKVRFVDNGHIATSSGLSAGIDLALHIVTRYFGDEVADSTAADLEYVGYGWKNPNNTGDLFARIAKNRKGPRCPVCDFGPVGKEINYTYKGQTYYFCSEGCKKAFVANPEKYLADLEPGS